MVLHLLPLPDGDGGPALHDGPLLNIDVASIAHTAVVQLCQQREHSPAYLVLLSAAEPHLKGVHLNQPDHWKYDDININRSSYLTHRGLFPPGRREDGRRW